MTDIFDQNLAPSDQVIETGVGDELVLLHLGRSSYYGLDPIGAEIWASLKAGLAPAAICAKLVSAYGIPAAQAEADARAFFADLKAHDILAVRDETLASDPPQG